MMSPEKSMLRMSHVRITLQGLFFIVAVLGVFGIAMTGFIYPFFFCPASPGACAGCPIWVLEHGVLEISSGSVNGPYMIFYLIGMFLVIGLLVGRSFCGLACPMGTLQDIYSFLKRKAASRYRMGIMAFASLLLLVIGTAGPYIAEKTGLEPLLYMWMGYVGAIGSFLLALWGFIIVMRGRRIWASISFIAASILLRAAVYVAERSGIEGTPLSSLEFMGLLSLMALIIGLVGLVRFALKDRKIQLRSGAGADRWLRLVKVGLLIAVAPSTYIFDTLAFTDIDPIGAITATIPELFLNPNAWSANQFFWLKMVFAVTVLALVAVVDRGWCRYLCPIGAMYGPTNKISISDIHFDGQKCIHCQRCIAECPMGINPKEDKTDPECVRCMRCIDACPVAAQRLVPVNATLRRWTSR